MKSNIFTETISRFRSNTTVQELTDDFKTQLKVKIFKKSTLQPENLLKKYSAIQRRYEKAKKAKSTEGWLENERKLFLWFILAYSCLHFKKLSEITEREWKQISACFGDKDITVMKYQTKAMERNPQRVRWTPEEQNILSSCIRSQLNGRWAQISKVLFFKTQGECFKTAKQCRQHWLNHMDSQIKRGSWTVDEDLIILENVMADGHHWSRIIEMLPTRRTQHMVKNRFGSLLSCGRKLLKMENQQITEPKLMQYLIKELRDNREFVELARSKEEASSESLPGSDDSEPVKMEENQNYFPCQKTEVEIKNTEIIKKQRGQEDLNNQLASRGGLHPKVFPLECNLGLNPPGIDPIRHFPSFIPHFSLPGAPYGATQMPNFLLPREPPYYQPTRVLTGSEATPSVFKEFSFNFSEPGFFPSLQNLASMSSIRISGLQSSEVKVEPTLEP